MLACDLHSGQSMGYFDISVDHVYGQVSMILSSYFYQVHYVWVVQRGNFILFALNDL